MNPDARAKARAKAQTRVTLRPITALDDPAVAEIIRAVMTEFDATGPGFAIHDPEVIAMSRAYDGATPPPSRYWVLDDRGVVLGGAGFAPLAGGDGSTCELRKMYFHPQARGLGLGRKLLRYVLDSAKADGYRRCYLETMATMTHARALYGSFGFEPLQSPEGKTGHFGCDAWYARDL